MRVDLPGVKLARWPIRPVRVRSEPNAQAPCRMQPPGLDVDGSIACGGKLQRRPAVTGEPSNTDVVGEVKCDVSSHIESDGRVGFPTRDRTRKRGRVEGRRVITGIELAQKIHKRQFAIPITLQSNPAVIWRHVMAA